MSYENFCQQLYDHALLRLYGAEVADSRAQMSESLVDKLYGLDAQSLFQRVETALTASSMAVWQYGVGWTVNDIPVPLDQKSEMFFKALLQPHIEVFSRMREVPLRDKVEATLLYRVDEYMRLLDWENRYNGTAFKHPKLPQNAVRNIVQAVTVLSAREEIDMLYFSKYGEFNKVLNGNTDPQSEGMQRVAYVANGFKQAVDFYFDLLDGLHALGAGQAALASGILDV